MVMKLLGYGVVFPVWVCLFKRKLNVNEAFYLMGLFFISLPVTKFVVLLSQSPGLSPLPKRDIYLYVAYRCKSEGPSAFQALYIFYTSFC